MELPARIGKYELQEFLGGGMSHVYRAQDTVLGRTVALKILTEAGVLDQESKARFLLEARMASNIQHDNIISVYDFGEENGRPFIVMEFLRGESLRAAIKEKHTGDLGNKIRIANQIGRALEYIHARKIVHRDIKPENVHVDTVGKVKLMDFGIAKSEGLSLTRAGFTLGTPYYMAPEQVLGQSVTYLVDVYAFGVLLYELLAGVKPISGDTVERIFNQILYEPLNIEPLRAVGVTPPLFDLILRCTAKQPAQRPQGFGIVCGELEALIDPAKPSTMQRQTTMNPQQTSTRPTQPTMPSQMQQQVQPRPATRPSQDLEGLPGFVSMLPAPLRTQTGLIALAGLMTLLMIIVLYLVLSFAKII